MFKEDQGPETSVPAEIAWAPIDSAKVVMDDGTEMSLNIDTATANPPQNADHIELNVNCEFLKQRPELILVDFPGYDSNIEAHNKSINNYLQKGSAFLMLIPAQNGGLVASDKKLDNVLELIPNH